MDSAKLARAHGAFNIFAVGWPLANLRSFEAVFGRRVDHWLVRTVAGLLLSNGVAQWRAADQASQVAAARQVGMGTALTLGSISLRYSLSGRISKMYLPDVVAEYGWVLLWMLAGRAHSPPEASAIGDGAPAGQFVQHYR